jgi:hypothetical protein
VGRTQTQSASSPETEPIVTAGEIFADGMMIELVAGPPDKAKPKLLLWNGIKASVGYRANHQGDIYKPPEIDLSLYQAMRLPTATAHYRSARTLFDGITALFTHHLGLSHPTSGLLAGFAMSTWLGDHLPQVLHLAMCGCDDKLGVDVLRLLQCLCRHALLIGEITPWWFRNMPTYLAPTLLLNQAELRPSLQRLLRTSCYRGMSIPGNSGGVVQLYGPKAVFCPDETVMDAVAGEVLRIMLTPAQPQPVSLDEKTRQRIAEDFQPKLLTYRLRMISNAKASPAKIDVSQFAPAMQRCAHLLAQCFVEDVKLAREAMQLLVPLDDDVRRNFALRVEVAIVETLLALLHEEKGRVIQVGDLTDLVNSLLQSRGERWAYTHEAIGRQLAEMTIKRERNAAGQRVVLDRVTSQRIHQMAQTFELAQKYAQPGCPDCKQDSQEPFTEIM